MKDLLMTLIPLGIAFSFLFWIALYIVTTCLRTTVKQVVDMNERLLIIIASKEGGASLAGAILQSSKQSKEVAPPPAKPNPRKGVRITAGARP